MFKVIFSIAFFIFAALAVLIGVMKGKKYRWQFSVSKIVLTIMSAIIAMLVSSLLGLGLGKALAGALSSSLVDSIPEIKDVEGLSTMISAIIAGVAAPILFYAAFPIVKALSGSFTFDFAHLLMRLDGDAADAEIEKRLDAAERGIDDDEYLLQKLKKERRAKDRRRLRQKELRYTERNILGALCGGVFAFLLFCIYLTPLTGMITVADDVLPFLSVTPIGEVGETVIDVVDGAANNTGATTVRAIGGKALFSGMTTYSVGGKSISLEKETQFISDFNDSFIVSTNPSPEGELDEERIARNIKLADGLRRSAQSFREANVVPALFAKILPEAVSAWDNGEENLIPKPSAADDLMPVLECLKNTSESTVKEDYATLANVYALALENDLTNNTDPLKTYANETFTLGTMKELILNDRFVDAVTNITNSQVSKVFERIEVPKNLDGKHDEFLDGLYSALIASVTQSDRVTYLKVQNSYIFDSVSLKVTPTALDTFVAQEMQQFGAELPEKDEFISFVKETPVDILLPDGTVAHKTISTQEQLEQYSYTVSFASINLEPKPVNDGEKEAQLLTDAFGGMDEFVTLLDDGETVKAIKATGPMLDALADSEIFGTDNTKTFLVAILQSDEIYDETGISKLQSVSIAESIAKSGNYTEAMEAIASGVKILEAASDGKSTESAVRELLGSISADSAEALKLFFIDTTLLNYGTSWKSSAKAAELMGHLFDNMARASEEGLSPDKIAVEAAAISDVFTIVLNANSRAESNLAFGENCVTGLSAMAHTSRVLKSQIASQTLVDAVYEGKNVASVNLLRMHTTLTEDEQNALIGALNSEWQSAPEQTDTLAKTLISIASLSNCEVTISGNEVLLVVPDTEETA